MSAHAPALPPVPSTHSATQTAPRAQMSIVIVGHVDHGKSTFVGRLFHDTDSLPDGKLEAIRAMCARRGMPFEWSFLMDALQAERDQGITIDTTQIWFRTAARDYVIIDAPGHKEFLKNMISGAAQSEAAVLLIDANEGVKEQSRRHGYLLHLLGVRQIAVAVNKMDLIGYDEAAFRAIETEYRAYLASIGVQPTYVIPISAREGDNVAAVSAHMPWYTGPTVTEALDRFAVSAPADALPLRLAVQDVYKFDERRIIAGRIESGRLAVGDEIIFSPSSHRVRVQSIERWPADRPEVTQARAGQSVGITLSEQIFVERGQVASHVTQPPALVNTLKGRIFWLGQRPLAQGARVKLKVGTAELQAEVRSVDQVVDTNDLSRTRATQVERGAVAEITLRVRGLAAVDDYTTNPRLGRFVIVDGYDVAGGGIISTEGVTDQRVAATQIKSTHLTAVETRITPERRALINGHMGGILWFTGLSGSGKSTLALELQKHLFAKGYQVYVLDGDNIRQGLCADLGFSPQDRAENIRRIGEVAALFARAGMIVITAFIAPYADDRRRARAAAPEMFHTVHVKADLATCEARDVKGLYKKARAGEIAEFTGISAPYEAPEDPELTIDTAAQDVPTSVAQLLEYVQRTLVAPVRDPAFLPSAFEGGSL